MGKRCLDYTGSLKVTLLEFNVHAIIEMVTIIIMVK